MQRVDLLTYANTGVALSNSLALRKSLERIIAEDRNIIVVVPQLDHNYLVISEPNTGDVLE